MKPNKFVNITLYCITVFLLLFASHCCIEKFNGGSKTEEVAIVQKTPIAYQVLNDGSLTAEKPSVEITRNAYLEQVLQNRDSIKQLKERIGKLDKLTNSLRMQLAVKGKANMPIRDTIYIVESDTVRIGKVQYHDKWLCLDGLIMNDSLKLDYSMAADLDIASYRKGKTLTVNVRSNNPNLLITGMENYQIREKKKFYETKGFYLAMGFLAGIVIPR